MKFSSPAAAAITLLLTSAHAEIVWTHSDTERRLALKPFTSLSDKKSKNCVVAGYDADDPSKIHVGGPCTELGDVAGAGFRYATMKTLQSTYTAADGSVVEIMRHGPHGDDGKLEDKTDRVEFDLLSHFKVSDSDVTAAGVIASTTSYLMKKDMAYSEMSFITGKTGDVFNTTAVCVKPCCNPVPDEGCACLQSKCVGTDDLIATAGELKYSLAMSAYDLDNAIEGSSGNGWLKAIAKWGAGSSMYPKKLAGVMHTYQSIDFTGMQSDKLIVKGTDSKGDSIEVKYSDMSLCSMDNVSSACKAYSVDSIEVAAEGWEGLGWTFPKYFNSGEWEQSSLNPAPATPGHTHKAVIECVRPSAATIVSMNGGNPTTDTQAMTDAAAMKLIWVRYKFQLAEMTATQTKGSYIVYDPSVNTLSRKAEKDEAARIASQNAGLVAAGRLAAGPAIVVLSICAAAMSVFHASF